jgi:hypothetical protein
MRSRRQLFFVTALVVGATAVVGSATGRIWLKRQDEKVRSLIDDIHMLYPRFASR